MRFFSAHFPFDFRDLANPGPDFIQDHYEVLFDRLKPVAFMLNLIFACFLLLDLFLLKNFHSTYIYVLTSLHLAEIFGSSLFLLIVSRFRRVGKQPVVYGFILYFVLANAAAALNSQLYSGNIYAYLIAIFAAAVIFPSEPAKLGTLLLGIHLLFIAGLYIMDHDFYLFLVKACASTAGLFISLTIMVMFFRYMHRDYRNKRKLATNEESFRRLFNMNPNPLMLADLETNKILLMNHQAFSYFELEGEPNLNVNFLFKKEQELDEIVKKLFAQKPIHHYVSEQRKKWAILHFELVDYLDTPCLLIGATDITDIKKKEEELLKYATYDILTGVRNRRSGFELLHNLLGGGPLSQEFILCYIDINNLKLVNDRFGHSAGDDLIRTCCSVISSCLDPQDVLFRLGGDEFVCIFYNKKLSDAEKKWSAIERGFESLNSTHGKPYRVSASYGFYHYVPGTRVTIEEMLDFADKEMYQNKTFQKASS